MVASWLVARLPGGEVTGYRVNQFFRTRGRGPSRSWGSSVQSLVEIDYRDMF